ncbi:MAG: hypothetical protein IJV40_11145 [Oscillospiraceae bacterium]|nr:hypothetical protein [Oscillospiraceae bacterium]
MSSDRKPLLVELFIPYGIRQEPFRTQLQLVAGNAEKNAYMAALKRELLSWEGELDAYEVQALRLSGGSATVMSPDLLGDLLKTAREILPMEHGAEITVDAQPLTIGTPALTGIAVGRPNRMELMMRAGSNEELQALGCPHTEQHVKNAILFFNRFHMNNYSLTVDLGIPGQTEQSWHNTIHACAIYRPAHIHLQTPDIRDAEGMPDEATRFAWYRHACDFLGGNGYRHYAAGDFCLPQHASRYTLAELEGTERLGLGLGAVTLLDGYLTRNTNNVNIYLANAGDYEKTTAQVYTVDQDYLVGAYVRQRKRAVSGLEQEAFLARFGEELPEAVRTDLNAEVSEGLLEQTETGYRPTERGLFRAL